MVSLLNQKGFQAVQNLPFCYLCGKDFVKADTINRDHLPARSLFAKEHREPLCLPTHVACNKSHELALLWQIFRGHGIPKSLFL
jgi:hypothetical protein